MIVTSYYARVRELQDAGFTCVSISNSQPRGCDFPRYKTLMPRWSIVEGYKQGRITWDEFTTAYSQQTLGGLSPERVIADIKQKFGENVALLCWERDKCHRKVFGLWADIPEF